MDISLSYGRRAQGDAASARVASIFRAGASQDCHADQSQHDQQGHGGEGELFASGDRKGHGVGQRPERNGRECRLD